MSAWTHRLLAVLFGGLAVLVTTLQMTAASHADGHYLPVGNDAFYHAARIMEAVETGRVPQFDPAMHAPGGDWVTWPWAYDASIASIARAGHAVSGVDPTTLAMHVPVMLGLCALILLLAAIRALELPAPLMAISAVCFGLHAFTQYQFGVGALDHHGAEQIAVLATLACGLHWLREPHSVRRAMALGGVLGLALGIHTALFVLQGPLLLSVASRWFGGERLPLRAVAMFSLSLLAGTLLMLLPAQTFWQGRFELQYLSLLQLYVSGMTCALMLGMSRFAWSRAHAGRFASAALILALPLVSIVAYSARFVSGDLPTIGDIDEIRSPFAFLADVQGLRRLNQVYTLLIWLAPFAAVGAAVLAWRERSLPRRYFWIWCSLGLGALLAQVRLGSLGVVFLYLAPIVMFADHVAAAPRHRSSGMVVLCVALALAYAPTVLFQLFASRVPAMSENYSTARIVVPALADACRHKPGLVLATPGDGHLVRYFTRCSVIANDFRLTETDHRKIAEALQLIGSPAARLHSNEPAVDYVLARLVAPAESENPVLFEELLNPAGRAEPGFRTLVQVGVTDAEGKRRNFLGVFAVENRTPTSDAALTQSPASSPGT